MGFSFIFSKVGLNTIHSSGVMAPLTIFSQAPAAVDYDRILKTSIRINSKGTPEEALSLRTICCTPTEIAISNFVKPIS
jgi:hypothetical protein